MFGLLCLPFRLPFSPVRVGQETVGKLHPQGYTKELCPGGQKEGWEQVLSCRSIREACLDQLGVKTKLGYML